MSTRTKEHRQAFSILESFKTFFSRKNLGKEAAIEHMQHVRNSRKKKTDNKQTKKTA